MGCGSSNSAGTLESKKKEKCENLEENQIQTFLTEEFFKNNKESSHNLENYDLLSQFLEKPRIKTYMEKLVKNCNLSDKNSEEFSGIYQEILPLIKELFNRYKIKIKIPESDFIVDVGSYRLICIPSSPVSIDLFLPFFFYEFCLYPKSYVQNSKVKNIIFIESLTFETSKYSQYRAACPEYNKTKSLYYSTKERELPYIRQVLHHEFFHYVDWTDDGTYDDPRWRQLNNNKFSYGKGGAYERVWKPLDPQLKGFINHYSTSGIEEDKAEIFQYLMSNPRKALNHPDEIVKNKVNYMYNWLCKYDPQGFGKEKLGNKCYIANLNDFRDKDIIYNNNIFE